MTKLISLTLLIFVQFVMTSSQLADYYPNCTNAPTFISNTPYDTNLDTLLTILSVQASSTGFYNSSVGEDPDQVYGLYLCRGDVSIYSCSTCVYTAQSRIFQNCSHRYSAAIWFDNCMLRYSNEPIFHKLEYDPRWIIWNPKEISRNETRVFADALTRTAEELVPKVIANSTIKFGTSVGNITGTLKQVYTLGQCTPDLTDDDCARCLRNANNQLPHQYVGGRVMLPSCNVRFELNHFWNDNVTMTFIPHPTNNSIGGQPSTNGGHESSSRIVIAISIPSAIVILLLFGACFYFYRHPCSCSRPSSVYRLLGNVANPMDLEGIGAAESIQFNFYAIRDATDNFSDRNKLGQGGFGGVYQGKLQNGQEIAVKRLSTASGQGAEEFKTEVVLVAKLQHKNLVKLLGFCLHGEEKLLVYELLPNASLDKVLLDQNRQPSLEWETRYKILLGTARGLLYLHEDSRLKIIHRDLKSSNVLLDENMNPKIADFGLARLVGTNQIEVNTNKIAGTYGYMAPEYALTGRFSIMSDVYSFGVMALEVVSGHKCSSTAFPFENESLCLRAWSLWKDGAIFDMVDKRLDGNFSRVEVQRCIHIGLLCIQEDANKRPAMGLIVSALNGHLVDLPKPEPPHVGPLTIIQYGTNRETQTSCSTSEVCEDDTSEIYPR